MDIIKREQIAAQLVGVMRADFERPSADIMIQILERAASQRKDEADTSDKTSSRTVFKP